jgi:thioredoxin-like negative regulator of GroEL
MLGPLILMLCVNDVSLRTDMVIQDLAETERLVDRGEYAKAREHLQLVRYWTDSATIRGRVLDLSALLMLRAREQNDRTGWIVQHFTDRGAAFPRDVRYRAWLAEALLAEGKQTAALALIADLQRKDLMPDAHAYVVLAKLSIGKQRQDALATCRKRARAKTVCRL